MDVDPQSVEKRRERLGEYVMNLETLLDPAAQPYVPLPVRVLIEYPAGRAGQYLIHAHEVIRPALPLGTREHDDSGKRLVSEDQGVDNGLHPSACSRGRGRLGRLQIVIQKTGAKQIKNTHRAEWIRCEVRLGTHVSKQIHPIAKVQVGHKTARGHLRLRTLDILPWDNR